jgi:hypothetical protein
VPRAALIGLDRLIEPEIGLAAGLAPGFFDQPMPAVARGHRNCPQFPHAETRPHALRIANHGS